MPNDKKIIMPDNDLIIPGQENAPNPMKEMDRVIRSIELAKGKGLATLVAVLGDLNMNGGWPMAIDESLPTGKCVITLTSHLHRDLKAGFQAHNEQVIRLGTQYLKAVETLQGANEQNSSSDENAAGGPAKQNEGENQNGK